MRFVAAIFFSILLFLHLSCSRQDANFFASGVPPASVRPDSGLDEQAWRLTTTEGAVWLVLHPDERGWMVARYFEPRNRLQEKIYERSFLNRGEALKFVWSETTGKPFQLLGREDFSSTRQFEIAPFETNERLWKVENSWNWEWEQRYATWVRQNVDVSFTERNQILTDCADVAYSTRWIFSYINKLPAANRLAGSERLFTQDHVKAEWLALPTSTQWDKDKRFRAALDYLLDNTYTHTLLRDSYPIKLAKGVLIEGTHHLQLFGESGHTLFVNLVQVDTPMNPPIQVVASTVPRAIRKLMQHYYWNSEQPILGQGGFLKMLWPESNSGTWSLRTAESMPNYSLEQFGPEFKVAGKPFALLVAQRLNPSIDFVALMAEGIRYAKELIAQRVAIVEEGFTFCQSHDCSPGTSGNEDWSTPTRDKRLGEQLQQLSDYANGPIGTSLPQVRRTWEAAQNDTVVRLGGVDYSLKLLTLIWKSQLYLSDPRSSVEQRWSLSGEGFSQRISDSVAESLSSRASRIGPREKYQCRGGVCAGADTTADDARIGELALLAERYCGVAGGTDCAKSRERLAVNAFDVAGSRRSIADWFATGMWLNASGKAPWEVRWGALARQLKYVEIPTSASFVVSKNGRALLFDRTNRWAKILAVDGMRVLHEETGVADAGMDMQSGSAYFRRGGGNPDTVELVVCDTNAVEMVRERFPANVQPLWHGGSENLLVLNVPPTRPEDSGNVSLVRFRDGKVFYRKELQAKMLGQSTSWNAPPFLVLSRGGQGLLVDLSDELPSEVAFALDNLGGKNASIEFSATRTMAGLYYWKCDTHSCERTILGHYDRRRKNFQTGGFVPIWISASSSKALCTASDAALLSCSVDAGGRVTSGDIVSPGFLQFPAENVLTSFEGEGVTKLFSLQADSWTSRSLPDGYWEYPTRPNYLMLRGSEKARLVRIDTLADVAVAPTIDVMESSEPWFSMTSTEAPTRRDVYALDSGRGYPLFTESWTGGDGTVIVTPASASPWGGSFAARGAIVRLNSRTLWVDSTP